MALLISGTITGNTTTNGALFKGGTLFIHLEGNFGGGTITIQLSYDNGMTYIPVSVDAIYTSSVIRAVSLPDCYVRLSMNGSTSPSVSYALSVQEPV